MIESTLKDPGSILKLLLDNLMTMQEITVVEYNWFIGRDTCEGSDCK